MDRAGEDLTWREEGTLRELLSRDGLPLTVREYGNPSAPPVVFIHGYRGSQLVLARQVHSELAERFRLVTYDVRGHGMTKGPLSAGRGWLCAICWDVRRLLDVRHLQPYDQLPLGRAALRGSTRRPR